MHLPEKLTTITPLSKYLSMVLFILLPFVGFYLGTKHQSRLQVVPPVESKCLDSQRMPQTYTDICPIVINRPVYIESDTNFANTRILDEKTKGWKTYQNSAFSISFKYPPGWEVVDLLRNSSNLPGFENTEVYLGIRPVTLVADTLVNIRVTTDSFEQITATNIPSAIKEYGGKYYVFEGNLDDEVLNTIYSTFGFETK